MPYLLDTNTCVFYLRCIKRYAKEKVRLRKLGKPMNENISGIKLENWFNRK